MIDLRLLDQFYSQTRIESQLKIKPLKIIDRSEIVEPVD